MQLTAASRSTPTVLGYMTKVSVFSIFGWKGHHVVLNPTMWSYRLQFVLVTHSDLQRCVKRCTFVAISLQNTHAVSLRLVEQMWQQQQMCNVHPSIMEASHSWQGKQLSEWDGCLVLTLLHSHYSHSLFTSLLFLSLIFSLSHQFFYFIASLILLCFANSACLSYLILYFLFS